mgnify:FL=1
MIGRTRTPADQEPIPPYDPDNPDADVDAVLDGLLKE